MPTPDVLASSIMDSAAALMNDAAKSDYTYVAQLPYLKIALKELREFLQLNNFPVTNETSSSPISLGSGSNSIGFTTIPALPPDLVEIQQMWQSPYGTENWTPVDKKEFIPHYYAGVESNYITIWAWVDNSVKFPTINADVDIKFDYIKALFTNTVDENTVIGVINSDLFLIYRVAGLCAQYIGENPERATELNGMAGLSQSNILGIDSKSKQVIMTRRRPFRASYKNRGVR